MADLAASAAVQTWLADYVRYWGESDPGLRQNLEVLGEFCQFVGREPDDIIADCLRQVEAGKRIRPKARRRYLEAIRQFEGSHKKGRPAGNVIRSFLIHNGIAVPADIPSFRS